MHNVRFDPKTSRVVIRARGFWNNAEFATYGTDIRSAFDALARERRPVTVLVDLDGYVPQSQDALGGYNFLGVDAKVAIARHAVVTGSAILRLQMRRLMAGMPIEFFADRASALAWLGWNATDPILAD